ncbi:MAG: SagB/ThcOx family dehydrogenase, partial [Chlorobiaceae bacterium]|nr:SagB/ThcOx family dehydrogenase [Chlorobiaceae bacterium]
MDRQTLEAHRSFLKDDIRQKLDFSQTAQSRRLPPPPVEKPFSVNAKRIDLPRVKQLEQIGNIDLKTAIAKRESCRIYADTPL